MDPIISLPYTEYAVASHLSKYFKTNENYSLFAPLSRQEKGVDLLLSKREEFKTKTISIQVKASRTYSPEPPKRENTKRFSFYTWFNRFEVPKEADLFALIGIYPPIDNRTQKMKTWWDAVILILNYNEMSDFVNNVKTIQGKPDKMFGFGFDKPNQIFQTRGDSVRMNTDFSKYLLPNRIDFIKNMF
ncbi:MAG: hypothetical protein A2Y41_04805 [Spirochaetes bacterium GWB1_36_13]|nr:MAG: hypothetical protein A2Y41_04805 [Spirochaetes bacterium GWB1_36_13]